MGVFSCFKGNKRDVVRNVQSAPPGLDAGHARGHETTKGRDGRRSAPGLTTPSKDESTPLQTTPNSPREIPEEIINGSKGDHSVAEVFDADMLTKLSSDLWNEREQALQNIDKRVKSHDDYSSADKMPLFNACCCILRKGTADKVAPVFFAACALLESITDSSFAGSIPADDVQASLMPLMTAMLVRTGETNTRVMECTCNTLISLSNKPCVSFGYAAKYIVQPIKSLRKFRLVWGRLELIRRAIAEFGIDKEEAFSATSIMPIVVPALSIADEKVRKLAAKLTAQVYRAGGKAVCVSQLEGASCAAAIKKVLRRKFDQIDGKLPLDDGAKRRNRSAGSVRLKPIRGGSAALPSLPTMPLRSMAKPAAGGFGGQAGGSMDMVSHPFGSADDLSPVSRTFQDAEEALMDAILNE